MVSIIGKELEYLEKSKGYVFSKKDLPNQVFSKNFDKYLFLEDVHQFDVIFFNQIKLFEKNIGGNYIYLHSTENFLPKIENFPNYYLNETPPCFKFSCGNSYSQSDVWDNKINENLTFEYCVIKILFGDSGKWGYYNTRDEQIGIIGLEKSVLEIFKQVVPYAFKNCFENFDEMLGFERHLTREENFSRVKDLFISNYSGKDI